MSELLHINCDFCMSNHFDLLPQSNKNLHFGVDFRRTISLHFCLVPHQKLGTMEPLQEQKIDEAYRLFQKTTVPPWNMF